MDQFKANQLESILKSKIFLGYKITELLNHGKSAAVFCGENKDRQKVAVKIFDNDLIERFGHDIQEKRIQQEIKLKGHNIPNLVKILDGGKTKIEDKEYYFIIMEFIEGQNLKQFIQSVKYEHALIKKVGSTILAVTEDLIKSSIVHRDLKPENVMIDTNDEITVMDLGVLKLIGVPSISDLDEKQFVGTLRYAPPEFLTRTEEDTIEGWRAVNFYQIGGILHDLIMKKELFEEYTPYSNLVIAIKEDAPKISSAEYPFETVQLVRDLLTKDFKKRLIICTTEKINNWSKKPEGSNIGVEHELDEIFKMINPHKERFKAIENLNRSKAEKFKTRQQLSINIKKVIYDCVVELQRKGLFKTMAVSNSFHFHSDNVDRNNYEIGNILYELKGELQDGFPKSLLLLTRVSLDENSYGKIELLGMFLKQSIGINLNSPLQVFEKLLDEKNPPTNVINRINQGRPVVLNIPTFDAFTGVMGFDQQFTDMITLQIVKIIKKSLKSVEEEVKSGLEMQEKMARGEIIRSMKVLNHSIMISSV